MNDEPSMLTPAPMDVPRIITTDKYENESEHPIPRKSMSSVQGSERSPRGMEDAIANSNKLP